MDDHLVTLEEASRRLSVPYSTLRSWAQRRHITPARLSHTGVKFYRLAELEARAALRKTRPTKPDAGHA